MEVKGILKNILETEIITDKFKKRSVILQTKEKFPQLIQIEFVNDKIALLGNYQIDQYVSISINIRGKEYVNKAGKTAYFNSIQGWKINEDIAEVTNGIQNELRNDINF